MTNLLIIFVFIIIVHAIYNLINYLRFSLIETLLIGNYTDNAELKIKAKTHKNVILNYIKFSGIKDRYIPISQALGFGQIANVNISIFENLLNPRQDIASAVMELLLEAKGNYWSRFVNSINPLYWFRIILYLPKNIISFLGMDTENTIVKILQLIYWFIGIIFTILLSVFPEEIKNFLLSLVNFN